MTHDETTHADTSTPTPTGHNRRGFLRNAAIAAAGTAAVVGETAVGGTPAFADDKTKVNSTDRHGRSGSWAPDPTAQQFTLAVMPDTQFLYWGSQDSVNREPQEVSFRYIIENSQNPDNNIVFMAHLGDLTQDADPSSFVEVGKAFEVLDSHGVAYSVLAGNHDVSGDDTRGDTPYLQTMGPQRFKHSRTFVGADSSGYNTAHIFQAAGLSWLLLALDWRTSDAGYVWANEMIKSHPKMPVIVTSHDIVASPYDDDVYPYQSGDPENNAIFQDNGQTMWEKLINDNDQVFLTVSGHYWPPGRMTKQNAAGNDVSLHITNYQNRYFGGGAMLRLYHFDLDRNMIDVETINPWILEQDPESRNELAAELSRVTGPVDNFSIPIDFTQRFSSFIPVPVRPPVRPARSWWRARRRTGASTGRVRREPRCLWGRQSPTCPARAMT